MRRPLVAVLAIVTALVAITGIGFVSLGGSGSSTVPLGTPTAAQIKIAVNGISACAMEFDDRDYTCLSKAYPELALAVGPQAVSAAFNQLRSKWPVLNILCHDPAHSMGAAVFKANGNVAEVIGNQDDTCQGGYLHGAFDAWQETGPSRDAFVEVAKVCNTFRDNKGSICFDGLAHDLWLSYPDVRTVEKVCGVAASSESRYSCLSGISMQMYAPAHGEPTNDISKSVTEIPVFCSSLREWAPLPDIPFAQPENPSILTACLSSVPYPLATLYVQSIDPKLIDPVLTPAGRQSFNQYLQGCATVAIAADPNREYTLVECQATLALYIMNLIPANPDLGAKYCRELFTDPAVNRCLTHVDSRR